MEERGIDPEEIAKVDLKKWIGAIDGEEVNVIQTVKKIKNSPFIPEDVPIHGDSMTQMDDARKGIITEEMKAVAKLENVDEEFIRKSVAAGTIAIPNNVNRNARPVGIGAGLRTKVNATIGTSTDVNDVDMISTCVNSRMDFLWFHQHVKG